MDQALRLHEDGAAVSYRQDEPGWIVVRLSYDLPGAHTRLHSHRFDHWMRCITGLAWVDIEGDARILRPGDEYLVEAHRRHRVLPLAADTVLDCRHEIRRENGLHDPAAFTADGIPLEWLRGLTEDWGPGLEQVGRVMT
ncbi:MAG TPA: hypothetical protein VM689_20655 [Aliidongia sp.]|nr:hypothetical protein [Aliidongia sp.]